MPFQLPIDDNLQFPPSADSIIMQIRRSPENDLIGSYVLGAALRRAHQQNWLANEEHFIFHRLMTAQHLLENPASVVLKLLSSSVDGDGRPTDQSHLTAFDQVTGAPASTHIISKTTYNSGTAWQQWSSSTPPSQAIHYRTSFSSHDVLLSLEYTIDNNNKRQLSAVWWFIEADPSGFSPPDRLPLGSDTQWTLQVTGSPPSVQNWWCESWDVQQSTRTIG